ncbi:MAG TPA: glycosyltransferase family 4 protein [Acidimicrobiales bacterium]|nr:glycosyltransferase family 4 protein [Acidimicrobiales bacterium]
MGEEHTPAPLPRRGGSEGSAKQSDAATLASLAHDAGIRRVHFVAWRDLSDPEAGGSELHAHHIAELWAQAGLDVTFRTSAVPGAAASIERDGYRVRRQSGRYGVFAGAAWEGIRMGYQPGDALVEIWNGMPFFSPLWYRGPRMVFLHHVHADMWGMVLPPALARMGDLMERKVAPRFYRNSRIVTLSESSRQEIISLMHLRPEQISVAPPGVDARYSPGGERSATPLVVAVGRLVPVKRFDLLIRSLVELHERVPATRAVIIGEGYERTALEALRHELGADEWLDLPGHVSDDELVDWYRRAWVVASSSQREGWGMTLTEAAACGTPAVATAIAGHTDAVLDGESGLLVDRPEDLGDALVRVIESDILRSRLAKGALARARWFTWGATARRSLEALAEEADRRR